MNNPLLLILTALLPAVAFFTTPLSGAEVREPAGGIYQSPEICQTPADSIVLTLDDAIVRARLHSVDGAVALNSLYSAYWQWRSFRADQLPEINFSATAPAYFKQFTPYMNDGGSYSFVKNNYLQLNGEVSITQNIPFTGGKLSLNTSLDFYRQFGKDAYNRFMSIPVALTLSQPIFGVNSLKWDRKIEPVRYAEAKAEFLSATEEVARTALIYYFQLLMAVENRNISRQNLANAINLYDVAVEKRAMGKISGNDLLQMELNLLNARSDSTVCESDYRSAMFQLSTFLDLGENTHIDVEIPTDIPYAKVDYDVALAKTTENNSHARNIMRRRLEADYEVARAKGDLRSINLFAQVGYTGAGSSVEDAYASLGSNQVVKIGFEIPLLDWGKRRGRVKVAESKRDMVIAQLHREELDFNQNLFILVERYTNQQEQVMIGKRADEIAAKRYAVNMESFIIGKISTLDLNDSRVNKDETRRAYVNELYKFWDYYYRIRSLTLWDFKDNCPIDADFNKLLR